MVKERDLPVIRGFELVRRGSKGRSTNREYVDALRASDGGDHSYGGTWPSLSRSRVASSDCTDSAITDRQWPPSPPEPGASTVPSTGNNREIPRCRRPEDVTLSGRLHGSLTGESISISGEPPRILRVSGAAKYTGTRGLATQPSLDLHQVGWAEPPPVWRTGSTGGTGGLSATPSDVPDSICTVDTQPRPLSFASAIRGRRGTMAGKVRPSCSENVC